LQLTSGTFYREERMKVLVTVKPVADPNTPPAAWIASEQGKGAGVNYVANYFDLIAVEQAIRLKDSGVTDICIVSVTTEELVAQVRAALAMGANRAIIIDPEGKRPDFFQIASALKTVVEREKPAFVLMGKQATDDDASQVGSILAGMLGWPQATFVSELAFNADKTRVKVGRETDEGVEVLDVKLPAVITCDLRLNEPRYATLPNLIKSKKAPMERLKLSELGAPAEAHVSVVGYALPKGRTGTVQLVKDATELVAALRARKLID
jgi:electron transfer flavoprotein beta subunit